jgi:hypothetical protein
MKPKQLGIPGVALLSALLSLGMVSPVKADLYTWFYSSTDGTVTGGGTLTTGQSQGGGYLITDATGTWNVSGESLSITLLAPGAFHNNDNILYAQNNTFSLDSSGFAFLANDSPTPYPVTVSSTGAFFNGSDLLDSLVINSVPVPGPIAGAGLPGLLLAGGGLLAWWRSRRKAAG